MTLRPGVAKLFCRFWPSGRGARLQRQLLVGNRWIWAGFQQWCWVRLMCISAPRWFLFNFETKRGPTRPHTTINVPTHFIVLESST